MKKILFVLVTLSVQSVFADSHCWLTSRDGRTYEGYGQDQGQARSVAMNSCLQSSYDRSVCRVPMTCEEVVTPPPGPQPMPPGPGPQPIPPTPPVYPPQPPVNPPVNNDELSCVTYSAGQVFENRGYDQAFLQNSILNQCYQQPTTSNSECLQNFACIRSFQRVNSVCRTYSSNRVFNQSSWYEPLTRYLTLQACYRDPVTSNSQCNANIDCNSNGGPVGSYEEQSCLTYSRGLIFEQRGFDLELVLEQVRQQCQANSVTSNSECVNRAHCQPTSTLRTITCRSMSRGLQFAGTSWDRGAATEIAVRACQSNPSTSDSECSSQVSCY